MSLEEGLAYKEKDARMDNTVTKARDKNPAVQRPEMSKEKVKGDGGRGSFEHRQ